MNLPNLTCAILADRHTGLSEGIRGLLESVFQTVYIVANANSLKEGAEYLSPALIVLDISLGEYGFEELLKEVHELSPTSKLLVLSVHDQPAIARIALASGAQGIVLKRNIDPDFLSAISAMLKNQRFISPDFGLDATLN